jgi:TonB family protein
VTISSIQIQRLDIRFGSEPVIALAIQPETNTSESKPKREEKSKDKASLASPPSPKAQEAKPSVSKQNEPQPVSPPASQNDETLVTVMNQAEAAAKTFAESEFTLAEKEIEVEGGMEAIYKRLVYPMAAEKAGIEGKVVVRIAVGSEGNVSQVLLISSASPLLNEEVFRVITEEVKFKPAIMDGKPVPSVITIPISFKLR